VYLTLLIHHHLHHHLISVFGAHHLSHEKIQTKLVSSTGKSTIVTNIGTPNGRRSGITASPSPPRLRMLNQTMLRTIKT
jgi:hypothetical protein